MGGESGRRRYKAINQKKLRWEKIHSKCHHSINVHYKTENDVILGHQRHTHISVGAILSAKERSPVLMFNRTQQSWGHGNW